MSSRAVGGLWKIFLPNGVLALRKVATIESVGSSTRIEGAKLSDAQVETLLSNLDQDLIRLAG